MSSIDIKLIGITDLDTDCIVNAANSGLAMGSGVCGAIFREAGARDMQIACNKIGGCPTGGAVITPGFRLKAKHVIHAVGPVWSGGSKNEAKNLYNCYRENRLRLMGYLLDENMEITPEGVAIMILNKDIQERFDFRQGESEGFVNLPLAIKEVRMSIFLTEEDNRFRVSIRSKSGTSANKCAMRYFNGGGHEMAAGGKLFFPENIPSPKDAKAYILKVSEEFFAK